ncbi:hypothetical protein NPIL_579351 [Nephila pilipes]|uniref:Uncharacterized protein n=1 Tax=Nephila pilipes TaxID=299642 RepID=A0A8X6MVN5_NEPPI|nr:hypothetical protein NPIL_579351 [Nephila pilipes]
MIFMISTIPVQGLILERPTTLGSSQVLIWGCTPKRNTEWSRFSGGPRSARSPCSLGEIRYKLVSELVGEQITASATSHLDSWSDEEVREAQMKDPDLKPIIERMESSSVRPSWQDISSLSPGVVIFNRLNRARTDTTQLVFCVTFTTKIIILYSFSVRR